MSNNVEKTLLISATPLDFSVLGPMILTHLSKMVRRLHPDREKARSAKAWANFQVSFFGGGQWDEWMTGWWF